MTSASVLETTEGDKYQRAREILWIVLGGWLLWLLYAVFGVLFLATIVGIPFGLEAIRSLSFFIFKPHGQNASPLRVTEEVVSTFDRKQKLLKTWESPAVWAANTLWILVAGFVLALVHLVAAVLNVITVVGVENAWRHLQLIPFSFAPFGRKIAKNTVDLWKQRPATRYVSELSAV